jgi:hypothetical protein
MYCSKLLLLTLRRKSGKPLAWNSNSNSRGPKNSSDARNSREPPFSRDARTAGNQQEQRLQKQGISNRWEDNNSSGPTRAGRPTSVGN